MSLDLIHHLQRFALAKIDRERLANHEAFLVSAPAWNHQPGRIVKVR
jgi:hypothetical protein